MSEGRIWTGSAPTYWEVLFNVGQKTFFHKPGAHRVYILNIWYIANMRDLPGRLRNCAYILDARFKPNNESPQVYLQIYLENPGYSLAMLSSHGLFLLLICMDVCKQTFT